MELYCHYIYNADADHIEFDAQVPASHSPGEVVQSVDGRRLRTTRQRISVRQQRQDVRLHRDRVHCCHCLPKPTGARL